MNRLRNEQQTMYVYGLMLCSILQTDDCSDIHYPLMMYIYSLHLDYIAIYGHGEYDCGALLSAIIVASCMACWFIMLLLTTVLFSLI